MGTSRAPPSLNQGAGRAWEWEVAQETWVRGQPRDWRVLGGGGRGHHQRPGQRWWEQVAVGWGTLQQSVPRTLRAGGGCPDGHKPPGESPPWRLRHPPSTISKARVSLPMMAPQIGPLSVIPKQGVCAHLPKSWAVHPPSGLGDGTSGKPRAKPLNSNSLTA